MTSTALDTAAGLASGRLTRINLHVKLHAMQVSSQGEVFFPANIWPSHCGTLKLAMLAAYSAFERFSEAVLLPLDHQAAL